MKKGMKYLILVGIAAGMLSMTSCGNKKSTEATSQETTVSVSLESVHEKVKEAYGESYIPNNLFDGEYIENILGLVPDLYEEAIAEGPLISTFVDTFIGIKAKEGKADEVEKALKDYQDYLINQAMMYPMNQAKVQSSNVTVHGNYVFFTMLGAIDDTSTEEEEMLKFAETENQKAVDVINSCFE